METGLYLTKYFTDRPVIIGKGGVRLIGSKYLFTLDNFFQVNEIKEQVQSLQIEFIIPTCSVQLLDANLNRLVESIEGTCVEMSYSVAPRLGDKMSYILLIEDKGNPKNLKSYSLEANLTTCGIFEYSNYKEV